MAVSPDAAFDGDLVAPDDAGRTARRRPVRALAGAVLRRLTAPPPSDYDGSAASVADAPAVVDLDVAETLVKPTPSGDPSDDQQPVAASPGRRSRLWAVAPLVGVGLALQGIGYAIGRSGQVDKALTFFFIGLLTIFLPCAWRMLAGNASRNERIQVGVILGTALVLSYFLLSPLMYTGYDELLHETTLWQLADHRQLFPKNSLLPVSPYYPGLEMFTLAVRWTTGLPVVLSELVTVLVSRVILVLVVFLFTERVTRSSRAGAAGVVVYAASPQFYSFNAGFSYQTLALSLGAGAVYLVLRIADAPKKGKDYRKPLAIACMAGTVVTHHLVGGLTMLLLVVFSLALFATRRYAAARQASLVTGIGLVFTLAWTAFTAPHLFRYLNPILYPAWDGIVGIVDRSGKQRGLFKGSSGVVAPLWQEAVLLISALLFLALVALAIRSVVLHRTVRGGALRYLPVLVAAGYLVVLGSRLSTASQEVGGRMSTFVFFGIAVVVGAWFATTRRWRMPVVLVIAGLCFLGSMLLGSGPDWSYVPGPYLQSADQRSIDAHSIDAAQWAASHLPENSPVAADRDDNVLMAAVGHLTPVTEGDGGVNVGPLYFDPIWGNYDIALVKKAHIRYLVVDSRLADGPPAYGYYFEPGETQGVERLTAADLSKFAGIPGVVQIYNNGPIKIYDLSTILGEVPLTGTHATPAHTLPTSADWWVLAPAVIVAGLWFRKRRSLSVDGIVERLLVVVVVGIGAMFAFVPSKLPAQASALVLLGVLFVLGLRHQPSWRGSANVANGVRRFRQWNAGNRWALPSLVLTVALVGGGTAIAVHSQQGLWRAPTSLSVTDNENGSAVAIVHLADPTHNVQIQAREGNKVLWRSDVPSDRKTWSATVPAAAEVEADRLVLLEDGKIVREVSS